MSVKQPECECIALSIQYETRMRHIVICGLPRSYNIFSTLSYNNNSIIIIIIRYGCLLSQAFSSRYFS